MAWSHTKTFLVGAGSVVLLWLLLRGDGGSGSGKGAGAGSGAGPGGGAPALTPCYAFLTPDSIRVSPTRPPENYWWEATNPSSVEEIARRCHLVYLRASGETSYGRVEKVVAELEARGVYVMREQVLA